MKNDVRNEVKLIEYPRLEEFTSATGEEIIKLIDDNKDIRKKYQDNLDYYVGKNVAINRERSVDKNNPDSRISVPYSRTFVQIVKGYMYKPGLISYNSENQGYMERLNEVFELNLEELKTSENGEDQGKYGLGVELVYTDSITEEQKLKAIPRFTNVKPEECIFIFNMDVESEMIGAIRYYIIDEDKQADLKVWRVEVYYMDRIEIHTLTEDRGKKTIVLDETYPNFFNAIPFVLYQNNQEYMADYESVKTLIDAYDILMSDGVNEMNRFAQAYLLLYNFILSNVADENEKRRELEKIKSRRVMEFLTDGTAKTGAEFLTRDIPTDFFDSLRNTLREDIEYHSHIPDFRGEKFAAKSGEAMKWSIFDFENLCGDKQAQFERGLQKRIMLINNFFNIQAVETDKVSINFERNLPINNDSLINSVIQLKATGIVSDRILLEILKQVDIIDDVDEALEEIKKQKEENMAMMPMNIDQEEEEVNE